MNISFYIDVSWMYLCISFGAMLLVSLIMNLQKNHFFTLHVFVRKFGLLDLQSPATPLELAVYINGIFALPKKLRDSSLRALKGNLFLDFLLMPLAYVSIFLLCMQISMKLTSAGHILFAILAWAQIIPWACDIIENIYLLKKIHPDAKPSKSFVHFCFQINEVLKWTFSLGAVVLCISTLAYFWLSGRYFYDSLHFILIILAEIVLFFIFKKLTTKNPKIILDQYRDVVN
jgi:hypothetical protein